MGTEPSVFGRIVTISNAQIFEQPVYNYTRDFPISGRRCTAHLYKDDRHRAEQIILEAVERNTTEIANMAQPNWIA